MQNRQLVSISADAGTVKILQNALSNPIYTVTARRYVTNIKYDELQRPIQIHVQGNDLDNIVEKIEYGESVPDLETAKNKNVRGKPIKHSDQAGIKEFLLYDMKGQNVLSRTRLRQEYKQEVDWNNEHHEELLEVDELSLPIVHDLETVFDALKRLVFKKQSDESVHSYDYHQSGLLRSVKAKITDEVEVKDYVKDIQYNAKGQRILILYGNGTKTTYEYERDTFRLESLRTNRSTDNSNRLIQHIGYIYDPVGNITQLTDNGHRLVFNDGEMVGPTSKYEYDSLYRLKHAEGRQHSAIMPEDHRNPEAFKQSRYLSFESLINNLNLLENYEEDYEYDFAGNIKKIKHTVPNNSSRSWTRIQTFANDSNRIVSTNLGNHQDRPPETL